MIANRKLKGMDAINITEQLKQAGPIRGLRRVQLLDRKGEPVTTITHYVNRQLKQPFSVMRFVNNSAAITHYTPPRPWDVSIAPLSGSRRGMRFVYMDEESMWDTGDVAALKKPAGTQPPLPPPDYDAKIGNN